MIIAVLKESKIKEGRVSLTPENVKELVKNRHVVLVQKRAGGISGFGDDDYRRSGAKILTDTQKLIAQADLIVKVKEPSPEEISMMRPGQMFFGYLHLAAFPELTQKILKQKITVLGYETLQMPDGSLPLLAPMSEIAGKMATQIGTHFLRADQGGRGILIGGTQTVRPAKVLVLGGGFVGFNAAKIALGMGGDTTVLDVSEKRLGFIRGQLGPACRVGLSEPKRIARLLPETDLLIGAVLICGAKAPKLVSESLVKTMRRGCVIVDVSVDQGGCVETSRVTSHEKPIFLKHGVLHYGVANIPGAVPLTATLALTNATFPYILSLADLGLDQVCRRFPEMALAVNCRDGKIIHPAIPRPAE